MKIIYWSDINCPYSYIELKRLNDAVCELDITPDWEFKSFELQPNLKNQPTTPMIIRHATKFGISQKEAEKEIEELDQYDRYESGLISGLNRLVEYLKSM